jgi:hypothetical protein
MEHSIRAHDPDANALICIDGNIPKHLLNVNISRLSCPYLRAIFGRHHPLTSSLGKKALETERQKAAMNLSQFVALTCRQLSPFAARSDAHSDGVGVNRPIFRQTSSLSTA